MGAKTGILAYASGSAVEVLRSRPTAVGRKAAESVLRRLHPEWSVSAEGVSPLVGNLWDAVYPPEDTAYVSSFPGLEIVCDQRFMLDYPWKDVLIRRMWMRSTFRPTDSGCSIPLDRRWSSARPKWTL
jgi:hypothetical protein